MILTVALTLVGCSRKTIYTHYTHTPVDGWEAGDTLHYAFGPVDKTDTYAQTIGLRTCSRYPFKELVLIVDQLIMPSGTRLSDTLLCRLTDEEGLPLAHGFNFYESSFPLRTIYCREGDSVAVRIHHYMKREILPGIADIGLTVKRKEDSSN